MIIFARKHFSRQYAGLFSFFIHLAIYIRAGIAAVHRLVKKLWLPILDFILMWTGFMLLLPYWETYRFDPGYYPDSLINYIVPGYILSWLVAMYYSGGYERPVSLIKIGKGLGYGTIFILVVYSLLPNSMRFSRAIILLGVAMSGFIILFERIALHFLNNEKYKLGTRKPKRVAIVGLKKESARVYDLLSKTGLPFTLAGYISTKYKPRSERYLGAVSQVREIIRINQIDELIFCSEDISSQTVIRTMLQLSDFKVDYKIAPPASVSIIGSNSIETAGDLYVVNVNAITREKNKRNKRLFDVVFALFLLLFSFITIWFVDNKKGFFRNVFNVLGRKYSWVGYHHINTELYLGLPVIRKGILQTTDLLNVESPETDVIDRLNVFYARDYKVLKDIEIVFKAFKKIGN
ncbi:MAG TPA: hypothetical protein VJ909_03550, partial [Prolixibacteraceae bacterium]|nr:hypothetical protein [Prolixibacteraceae bacterium]